MKRKWMITIALLVAAMFLFSGQAVAKSKKSKKKARKEKSDPLAGRFGVGFSLGGSSGSGGTGFSGSIGVTYYIIKYLSLNGSVGYGFAPYIFENSDGDDKKVNVNFLPADISLLIHPLPLSRISPYFGPGGGITYTWYNFDDKKYEETWYNAFVEGGVTYWAAKSFGLNVGVRYTIPYYDNKWQTDDGQISYGMSGSFVF